jgi:hypothetical protein
VFVRGPSAGVVQRRKRKRGSELVRVAEDKPYRVKLVRAFFLRIGIEQETEKALRNIA